MSSFVEKAWEWFVDGLSHFFSADVVPALQAWFEQFKSEAGQIALSDAKELVPQVIAGQITMLDAIEKLASDLAAKGVTIGKDVVGNAIRTQLNAIGFQ